MSTLRARAEGPLTVPFDEVFNDSEFFAGGTADLREELRGGLRLAMRQCLTCRFSRARRAQAIAAL
jgi:hypothetical protein